MKKHKQINPDSFDKWYYTGYTYEEIVLIVNGIPFCRIKDKPNNNQMNYERYLTNSILNGESQAFIFGVPVSLPSPQKTGSSTARKAYAKQQAQLIIKNLK